MNHPSLYKAIAALGSWKEVGSPTRAMKGYIGLSRVRCADDLLLAEPFSPCLFTQGEQPWPTLLLSVQKGLQPLDDNFENLCVNVEREARRMKKLTAAQWYCSTCRREFPLSHFVSVYDNADTWYKHVLERVVKPGGGTRTCKDRVVPPSSPVQTHRCITCKKAIPADAFSESMWHNRNDARQRVECLQCQAVHAPVCDLCRKPLTTENTTDSM